MDALTVLDVHLHVWDMPTLAAEHPEVVEWLHARWHVDFDMMSNVVLVERATGLATLHHTTDVRVALLDTLRSL